MKQAQFITLMSESLGVEEKTIRMIVRNLREAGLFTTGARGVNAPDITPLDAVRVVISVVASPSPSRAVQDVRYFGSLKPDMRGDSAKLMMPKVADEDATLEETLLACCEDRLPYDAVLGGYVRLSERGAADVHLGGGWVNYHQREQWAAAMAALDEPNDVSAKKDALESWESLHRTSASKVNRSAEFPLDELSAIGWKVMNGEEE